jgi:hypothetical protein
MILLNRSFAALQNSLLISNPIKFLFKETAASAAVPLPINGSRTI